MGAALPAPSRVPLRRRPDGGAVPRVFWPALGVVLGLAAAGVDLASPDASAVAAALLLCGGLPHGAYDLALAGAAGRAGAREIRFLLGGYVAVALAMAAAWWLAPAAALGAFLVVAAVHFGEDWDALPEPVLRVAAGASVIAAPLLGQTDAVIAIFEAIAGREGGVLGMVALAASPVALLVGGVGLAAAWRNGARAWAVASAAALSLLLLLPPLIGFALFFVFLHSPKHLHETRALLAEWSAARFAATGAALSACAAAGWWIVRPDAEATLAVDAFRLLAVVAAPHLLLSTWVARRLVSGAGDARSGRVPAVRRAPAPSRGW